MTQTDTVDVYVDYEGLIVSLSKIWVVDAPNILIALIDQIRQEYSIHRVVLLADWRRLSEVSEFIYKGFVCRSAGTTSDQTIGIELRNAMLDEASQDNLSQTIILITGKGEFAPALRFLETLGRYSVLWAIGKPSASDAALCNVYLPISIESGKSGWSHTVVLSGIAVACMSLQEQYGPIFDINYLFNQLEHIHVYREHVEFWLAVALREQILFVKIREEAFYITANLDNPIVDRAQSTVDQIMTILETISEKRGWAAFNTLERALRTGNWPQRNQRHRQMWIELLVMLDLIIVHKKKHKHSPYPTTSLSPNPDHPLNLARGWMRYFQLVRLIITVDNFLYRRYYSWMAVSELLRRLTEVSSRVEARMILSVAEEQGIIHLQRSALLEENPHPVTTLYIQHDSQVVADILNRRDELILLASSLLARSYLGMRPKTLIYEFISAYKMSYREAEHWLLLMQQEQILLRQQRILSNEKISDVLLLNLQDPIVTKAFDYWPKQE